MMRPTKRYRELIADLLPKSARLCKTQVVRVAGLAATDEVGLFRNELPDAACLLAAWAQAKPRLLLSTRKRGLSIPNRT